MIGCERMAIKDEEKVRKSGSMLIQTTKSDYKL